MSDGYEAGPGDPSKADAANPNATFQPHPPAQAMTEPMYEFICTVHRFDTYGKKIKEYPATVFASTISDAVDKLRAVFGAKYDEFQRSWSHDVFVESLKEAR